MVSQEECLLYSLTVGSLLTFWEVTEINHLLQQQQQYTLDPELYVRREEQDYLLQNGSYRRGSVSTDDPMSYSKTITGQLCGDIFALPLAWSLEDSMARSTTRIYNLGVMIDDLHSKQQCESLIWTYMKGNHTLSPLFHGPSFLQQARRYIERYLRSLLWRLMSISR